MTVRSLLIRVKPVFRVANFALKIIGKDQLRVSTGAAGKAFWNVLYPEGILPRGSIWPFGLYICPVTGRFFCFFHNETGWNCKGTGYVAEGPGDDEPDFRHIGLMHSDDCGKTWKFDRWLITSEAVCYSDRYVPDGSVGIGQKGDEIALGAGDFSIFVNDKDGYIYLFYNICAVNIKTTAWLSCDVYVARTRIRHDGVMGDFVKYYKGSLCEAGNLGKESAIAVSAWHPRVVYHPEKDMYIMSSMKFDKNKELHGGAFADTIQVRFAKDLLNWSNPTDVRRADGSLFGNHYNAIVSSDEKGQPCWQYKKAVNSRKASIYAKYSLFSCQKVHNY